MGFIFGGDTGQSQEGVTDARKRLAAAMLQQGTDTSPIQSPWEGAARMAQALMGGLAVRKQGELEQAALAQYMPAITGQPYTPPEQPKGFLSSLFGGDKATNPGATGSAMPKVDSAGNIPAAAFTPGGNPEVADYIRQASIARGMDPNIVLRGVGHEGLNVFDPSQPDHGGDEGSSFGPFQLHYAGMSKSMPNAGLGDEFTRATGLHASDPSTWKQQVDFALDWARKHGWGPWMGFKAEGITGKMGIGELPPQQSAQAAPPASPIQPPVIPPPATPTPGYRDAMVTTAGRPDVPPMPPAASAPGEVASLDPSVGIPMPGAAGQMRASDPAQVMPPRAGQQSALPPLPTSTVGPTPNVASVPSVADPRSQIPPEFQRSPQLMNADPNKGILQAILGGGSPASPEQVAQAQQSGQARLAQALDNAPQAPNAMANPRVQALVQAISNPNVPPQMKAMAAQQLQVLMKPPEYGFETLPDGTVLRSDPRTGTVAPIYQATPKPVEVNGRLVDPVSGRVIADYSNRQVSTVDGTVIDNTTGQPVYQSHKPMDVNSRLVDPVTGQQIADYSNPNVSEVDGALVDQRTGKVIYQGKPKGMAVQPGETVVNPQTGEVLHQGAGYKPEDVSNLRKEIQNLPSYKSYQQALPSYQSMIDTAKTDSKASDLNLVYGLGKIMDPNSVVREGEMVMVNNTSSLPDWLQGAINSVNGGSRLEPATRTAILNEARSRLVAYRGSLDNDVSQYRGIIGRRGMNEADILPTLGDIAAVPDLAAPKTDIGPAPEGVPEDVWGAMTPAERKLWQK
ncbi:hypothetical protein GGI55_001758 [Rhizobium leguminosarum]|uniref:hypothetical protein n=1 Tax=Rhizobium TaxID=379 RepID=UPI0017B1119B|nr:MULTISPECIES: hypothetical protein [Rhizobium]MBB4297231.1 hypothetical protein [Rhizobium leguminosarum]MBB4415343.1 hypothetical protein [Rhizobium leguminosarum]MBB4431690.1 hypothetical protein [Rhizobium esperanzae]MBB4539694.1 hypothetical protein [Rhizobium leguminosarum]MBB5651913.1 hypothetical protein [Rhizobium leguminosarum]